ncbi:Anti-sigma-K factor RskA [Actinacidiphila yanglinensis]|uniref:Regulator of SigK n=1 Tax=Actinacidiphila yanglinensis TaxID=310779 RepID=A0A1H5W678_9ACTN|nr:anti-sigma factor [Actinacidiphila yanglinensis]SEF95014.1 Anti-sigma-K factor RskA [Actinacidiphila yanglinensis]
MTTTDPHALTGAYALHALPDEERAAFERHLAGCESCAQEVAEFSATAARLALAAAVPTRPAMREEVLRRVATVRQLPPAAASLDRARRSVWRGRGAGRRALAACVAAAVACGGVAVWQYQRAQDAGDRAARAQRQVEELAGVLAAPDAKSRVARIGDGAATLVVSAGRDRAVFVASRMAAPPRGKVYELWFSDGGKMRAAGLMDPDRSSQAVLLRGKVDGASGIGITVEPEGGSRAPTTPPLALLGLPT